MSSTTKIEQNAVNEVRNFIDATDCLRSYLKDNDRTPLWDGSVFVYHKEPDKKENLVGTVKAQVKGTEVKTFRDTEKHRVERHDLEIYMKEGGLFFFVVEMQESDIRQRRIFYKKLTPVYIQALLNQNATKGIDIPLDPLPADYHIIEDEMLNFINDSRNQTSFVGRQGLTFDEALKGNYQIKGEVLVNKVSNETLAMQLTSQPFYLYQDTPYAKIPISDIELSPIVTEKIDEPVSINGKTYFPGFSRKYDQKTVTVNIGDCFITRMPKEAYAGTMPTQVEIKYPNSGGIDEAINAAEFLVTLKDSTTITFGKRTTPLTFPGQDREKLFGNAKYNLDIYRDMKALWLAMQIPGTFSFDDFDEQGLNQYLSVVQHVYRKEEGVPLHPLTGCDSSYAIIPAGHLRLLVRFTHTHDKFYSSEDGFARPYTMDNGHKYPVLSASLAKAPDVVFDNIHYSEQLECYKECLANNDSFMGVIQHDLQVLEQQKQQIKSTAKLKMFSSFVDGLKQLL
jgi:hypothetical protein